MNNPGNRQADKRLFDNCRDYIPGEIKLLKPDVLVTQGDYALVAISSNFRHKVVGNQKKCGHAVLTDGDRDVLWFHTYHPSSFANFHQQKPNWPKWGEMVHEFYRERHPM
jgi:uracil-DNA glycosylase